jgi:hypothetical protein
MHTPIAVTLTCVLCHIILSAPGLKQLVHAARNAAGLATAAPRSPIHIFRLLATLCQQLSHRLLVRAHGRHVMLAPWTRLGRWRALLPRCTVAELATLSYSTAAAVGASRELAHPNPESDGVETPLATALRTASFAAWTTRAASALP